MQDTLGLGPVVHWKRTGTEVEGPPAATATTASTAEHLAALEPADRHEGARSGNIEVFPVHLRLWKLEVLVEAVSDLVSGLEVLCEKPLVTDLNQARDLDRPASASETVLMLGYQCHFLSEFQHVRERWASGIRQPDFISVEIIEDWLQGNTGTWRVDPSLSGGGFLSDTGSHVVDAVLGTTGLMPKTVRAEIEFYDNEIDMRANVTVEFEEGLTAHLSFHSDVSRVSKRLQV